MAIKGVAVVTQLSTNSGSNALTDVYVNFTDFTSGANTNDWFYGLDGTTAFDQVLRKAIRDKLETNYGYTWAATDTIKVVGSPVLEQSAASRSLNTAFQISINRDAFVTYSVDISCTLSLTGGQTGTVFLEIANDSGFTSGVQEIGRTLNANTGTLTIGLNITQSVTGQLYGIVPQGKYVRIRTANTVGSPSFNWRSGQEALL